MSSGSMCIPEASIFQIEQSFWNRGGYLKLPVRGASFPWICREPEYPLLIVFPDHRVLSEFKDDWFSLFQEELLELKEIPLDADSTGDPALYIQRGEVLKEWSEKGSVLLATPGALIVPAQRASAALEIRVDQDIPRAELIKWLQDQGYESSENVWSPGQYVIRGSIIDIFDPAYHFPARLEFFDENLEQIRFFKPRTQKSIGSVEELEVHGIRNGHPVYPAEMFPEDLHIILYEPVSIEDQAHNYIWLWKSLTRGTSASSEKEWADVYKQLTSCPVIRINRTSLASPTLSQEFRIYPCPHFKGRVHEFRAQCSQWKKDRQSVLVYSMNDRFLELADEMGIRGYRRFLSRGFHDTSTGTVIVSDLELAGLVTSPAGEDRIFFPQEWDGKLASGDWVIHEDYGICSFAGLETVQMDDSPTDMFVLEFAEEKRLLMPITQFSKLSRLTVIPGNGVVPDTLGGRKWKKQVKKDREKAREEARRLLQLYAEREILKGFGFGDDGEYMQQLERSFPFVETADQLTAIRAVKGDMEKPLPMDRLIVGDVGYGKTEVAIRAAMKAVESGKQVAVLAPTTILAQQHYNTFSTRMSGYPLKIEVLSRFVKSSRQKQIKEDIGTGKVDIIIGTQRLLQKDISFRDLGLLVIDEEHRFGVLHKEKLKDTYRSVDVLTLSATPIPRTLSMSLKGLKGISVISTPPENRMPIMTFVGPWRDGLVQKAITREFTRGGQVFFVHNRVETIEKKATVLKSMFPDAVVSIAHGQMNEKELEKNMLSFYSGDTDMLVCTTIVESGLDVGRANTMIIDDSHELGLAQLYQLRGRIGRRGETGYAFFLYPEDKVLSPDALERLEAISELGTSGSGYSLSMRDLTIRGAGEFAGTMQHGRTARIGFDYYYELLEDEINRLRGIRFSEPEISLDMGVTIPSSYIPQEGVRISLYRRLLQVSTPDEVGEIRTEMEDRFGPIPGVVQYLLDLCLARRLGGLSGIISISSDPVRTRISFSEDGQMFRNKAFPGWMFRNNEAVGPGGFRGMNSLVQILKVSRSDTERNDNSGGDHQGG